MEFTGARRCGSDPVKSNNTPVGVDHHARHQTHRLVGEPVVVHVTLGLVLPLRQLRQLRPRAPIRVGDELAHVEAHRLRTVAFEQRRQPPHAGVVGRELSPEVARRLALGPHLGIASAGRRRLRSFPLAPTSPAG